jgi:hypothetical protein
MNKIIVRLALCLGGALLCPDGQAVGYVIGFVVAVVVREVAYGE